MAKEDLPITPRPTDPFTAQDGMRLYTMVDSGLKKISSAFEEFSNRLANTQRLSLESLDLLRLIEAEFSDNRVKRLELEIDEAERERDLAIKNLQAIESKLTQKQNIKEQSADTGEKLKAAASVAITDLERKKKESAAARWEDIKWTLIKVVLTILVGGAVSGLLAFIWFLVQLYLNRGAP